MPPRLLRPQWNGLGRAQAAVHLREEHGHVKERRLLRPRHQLAPPVHPLEEEPVGLVHASPGLLLPLQQVLLQKREPRRFQVVIEAVTQVGVEVGAALV